MDPQDPLALFQQIVAEVSLPIVMICGVGYLAQMALKFDVTSVNRVAVWVLLPCLIFHTTATMQIGVAPGAEVKVPVTAGSLGVTLGVTLVQWVLLLVATWGLALAVGLRGPLVPLLALCIAMPNSGNYGIPLVVLAYGVDWQVYQIMIMAMQSILLMTVGVALVTPQAAGGLRKRVMTVLTTPFLPALILGFLANGFTSATGLEMPSVIIEPTRLLGTAMVPVALFTLGAMLVGLKWESALPPMVGICIAKFLFAPGVTAGLLLALGMTGRLGDLFLVTATTPIANLVALLAVEHVKDRETRDLIVGFVFVTTAVSPVALTGALMLTGIEAVA